MDDEITAEKIAQHYSSAMDSVNLINAVIADPDAYANDETVMQRNVDHLELVIDWTFWTDEDLSPFTDAITAGKAHVAA
jgi:hypothetical protein